MRVPLPGRDYFPPRVLLGAPIRPAAAPGRASMAEEMGEDRGGELRGGLLVLRPGPPALPAAPPMPVMGLRPAA